MGTENDKALMELFKQLSEKTSALLQHLKSRDVEKEMILEMEEDLKRLQEEIRRKTGQGS